MMVKLGSKAIKTVYCSGIGFGGSREDGRGIRGKNPPVPHRREGDRIGRWLTLVVYTQERQEEESWQRKAA